MKSFFRVILVTVLAMVAVAANAEDYTLTVGANTLKGFAPANATYTAEADCNVLVEAQEVFVVTYNEQSVAYQYVPGSGFSYTYEVNNVKAGEVVTVKSDFIWNTTSVVRISVFDAGGSIPVEPLSFYPARGTVFSWNTTGLVTVNFNKAISVSGISLVAGEYEEKVTDVHVGSNLGFNITEPLNALLRDGKLNPGETFQVKITGLCDMADKTNVYGEDGVLVFDYIAPYPQHNFVSATVADNQLSYTEANTYKFLSFYPKEGTDGVFTFEFDDEVGAVNAVILTMGNLDLDFQGKYHRSNLPYTIDGKKIIVDVRGELRTIAVLFPFMQETEEGDGSGTMLGDFDTSHLTITLQNVTDKNGNVFRTVNQGSVGSYAFVMGYEEIIDEAYIDGDNKTDGDDVVSGENIRLWLSNADIKFEGFEVTYFVAVDDTPEDEAESILEPRKVVVTEYTTEEDPYGIIVAFNMPNIDEAAEGTTVRVALSNASSSDGMPHYLYIEFKAAGTADGIAAVADESTTGKSGIYTLSGVKVRETEAGRLYIVNGKKVKK